ncbi:hypothetical protein [Ralstonia sp. 24A2]|uniref:hypothetical protein n=1 Tax=Ralstonia sp. 24A2 TaxID=3447364 RepID=UPI003F6A3DA9
MFFDTPNDLLKPIHSLLKRPFAFQAGASIGIRMQSRLQIREDFEDLLALGCLFDEANQALKVSMASLRPRLEDELASLIPMGADLDPVCRSEFSGAAPQVLGMDGARYLSHVSVQCQLERLYDHFELKRSGRTNPLDASDCADALKILMLSDALALSLAGVATVKRNKERFDLIVRDQATLDVLRNTWFARLADQSSHATTIALTGKLAREGASHLREVEVLTERILEQDLSISWRELSTAGRTLRSVERIHAAAGLVAVLTVLGVRGESLRMSGPELSRHGLDFSTVAELIRRQAGALVTDQFITRRDDLLSVRVEGASKGLRQLFRLLESEYGEREALRAHVGGLFYEQTHIRQRIELGEDYRERYRIFDGFDRYKVIDGGPNECDVEFILQDFAQGHYYFIQVKHALLGERAFFDAIIEALQKDIGKGLHQLREAKRLLEDGHLGATLEARGITDATPANSSFVLLHNIAQLDFQHSKDGVSLYDWATFRNLLKDAECYVGHSDGRPKRACLPTPLIVNHPTLVIRRLLSEHPAYTQIQAAPWAQERAATSYEILGKMICVRGLGI